jgi:hypothetical protein
MPLGLLPFEAISVLKVLDLSMKSLLFPFQIIFGSRIESYICDLGSDMRLQTQLEVVGHHLVVRTRYDEGSSSFKVANVRLN